MATSEDINLPDATTYIEFDGLIWPRPVATPPEWGQIRPSFSTNLDAENNPPISRPTQGASDSPDPTGSTGEAQIVSC